MKLFTNGFQKVHLYIFLGFVLAFSGLTLWVMLNQSPGDRRDNQNVAATLLTFSGPFTGAIARPSEPSCFTYSLKLFPYCAAFLLGGAFFQIVRWPFRYGEQAVRIIPWVIALLGWFTGSIMSLMYAMS